MYSIICKKYYHAVTLVSILKFHFKILFKNSCSNTRGTT
jgi:hypothetical protein